MSNQPTNDTNQNDSNKNPNSNNNKSENSNDGVNEQQQKIALQNEVSIINSQNFQKSEVMNNDYRLGMMVKNNGMNLYDSNNMFKMNQNMIPNMATTQNVGFTPIDYSQRMNNANYQFYGQPLFILPSQDCLFIPIYKPQNNYFTVQQPMQNLYNSNFQACPNYPQNQQNYMGMLNKKQGEN